MSNNVWQLMDEMSAYFRSLSLILPGISYFISSGFYQIKSHETDICALQCRFTEGSSKYVLRHRKIQSPPAKAM